MFTTLETVRSLDKASGITLWAGLAFTAALLVVMAFLAWEIRQWFRKAPAEHTSVRQDEPFSRAA
jgi:hypothetical protein